MKVRLSSGALVGSLDCPDVPQGARYVTFSVLDHKDLVWRGFMHVSVPVAIYVDETGHQERCLVVDNEQLVRLHKMRAFRAVEASHGP